MPIRLRLYILAVIVFPILFIGCSKSTSSDNPLTPTYNASIYIGGDNHIIYALDPVTGLKNWEFSCAAPIIASPLVYNERVYVGTFGAPLGDTLYKLDAQTGAIIKRIYVSTGAYGIKATPVADGNLIYLACTNGVLYAIDTGSYVVSWAFTTYGPGSIRSSPVIYNGYVYFGCDDGNIYCVDKTLGPAGTHNWNYNPFTAGVTTHNILWNSSPAIGYGSNTGVQDTVLCIGGDDSSMYCLQLVGSTYSFTQRWRYRTKGAVNSSPTLYGGACIFGCEDFNVYCIDINSDTIVRWKVTTNSNVYSSPYAYRGVIYAGSNDYNLYAINFWNGNVKWTYNTAGMIKSSPLIYGPYVYVGSYDKSFYCIDTALGQKKWSFTVNNNIQCSPAVDNNTGGIGTNSSISGFVN